MISTSPSGLKAQSSPLLAREIVPKAWIEKALDQALVTGADFAEVFVEDSRSTMLSMIDGKPKGATVGRQYGAGVRVHFGVEEIHVTTNDLSEAGLVKAAKKAAQAQPLGERKVTAVKLGDAPSPPFDYMLQGDAANVSDRQEKFAFMKGLDTSARKYSSKVSQTEPLMLEKMQEVQIANSLGVYVTDQRANYRVYLEVFVDEAGVKESYHKNEWSVNNPSFFKGMDGQAWAEQTTESALTLLKADFAPAGEFPVVIDNGFGGVIFHEACGHGLETTSVAHNASVFCGKLGEKVADACVTAIDDGTIEGGWGSLSYDDEGRPVQKTTLIENGILKSYMVDQLGAKKTGFALTGSGRKQNYKFTPTSRMRNTFIAPGTSSLEEMIKDVDYGIYAKDMGGGSVSPGTGDFNFAIQEAYLIKNGQISTPIKGASLIGRGIETLGKITKVGKDLKLAAGMCGSVSGSIPAAVGQPPLLVSKILVGGRA